MKFFIALFLANLCINLYALDSSDSSIIFKNFDSRIDISNYFVSEKFDGIRALWDGKNMFSKRGKIIAIPRCFAEKLAPLALQNGEFVEGELWIDYGDFEGISSVILRKNPSCEDFQKVKYLIFNAHLGESSDFLANLTKIKNVLDSQNVPQNIQVIAQHKFATQKELDDFFNAVVAKGGEGVIVRDSQIAFKLKPQNDAECKIINFSRGKGRIADKVGAIICESLEDKNSGIKAGLRFKIGSGLSDKMRQNPPQIGTIITYKFSGVSKNGIPKHTRFLRIYKE